MVNVESYISLEYFFNSIFPLKVLKAELAFFFLAGLVCAMDATLTLGLVLAYQYIVSSR